MEHGTMQCKAEIPYPLLAGKAAPALVQAYFEFNHLKQLYRQGWLREGIDPAQCESVAEHTFGVAVLAYLLAESYFPELDSCRVLRIALLHDFGEIYAGDITPEAGVSPAEKEARERQAVQQVLGRLPRSQKYLALWEEYEAGSTPEARFVKQVDRLEMALQADVYEHQGHTRLDAFFDSARKGLSDPRLIELMEQILLTRNQIGRAA
jgi:putative hydrolases of HD superfamily